MKGHWLVPSLVWLWTAGSAQADGGQEEAERVFLLAPAKLEAKTDGESELKAGFGVSRGVSPRHNLGVLASFRAKTKDGLGTLFRLDEDGTSAPSTWEAALSVNLTGLTAPEPRDDASVAVERNNKEQAAALCIPLCHGDDKGLAKEFCDTRAQRRRLVHDTWIKQSVYEPAPMCAAQSDALDEAATKRAQRRETCAGEPTCLANANAQYEETLRKLQLACIESCDRQPGQPFCKRYGFPREPPATRYSPEEFCPGGQMLWKQTERDTASFVPWSVSAGASVGAQTYDYRSRENGVLVEHSDTEVPWSVGGSGYFVWYRGSSISWTLELLGNYATSSKASNRSVEWCTPEGEVPRDADDPSGPSDPAESCQKATLGGPTTRGKVRAAAIFGLVDEDTQRWRVGIGPYAEIPTKGATKAIVSLVMPVHLSFAQVKSKLDYKGLVRVTPSLTVEVIEEKRNDVRVTLDIAVLGQRYLFSQEFDEF